MKIKGKLILINLSLCLILPASLANAQTCMQDCIALCNILGSQSAALSPILNNFTYDSPAPNGALAQIVDAPLEAVAASCYQSPSTFCQQNCPSSMTKSAPKSSSSTTKQPNVTKKMEMPSK